MQMHGNMPIYILFNPKSSNSIYSKIDMTSRQCGWHGLSEQRTGLSSSSHLINKLTKQEASIAAAQEKKNKKKEAATAFVSHVNAFAIRSV
jgi:hypothetical protein